MTLSPCFSVRYFRQSKLTSFQRQLNLYGFQRLTRGADAGGYYHELFLRGRVFLAKRMERTKVKGTRFKAASSPDSEPDFYSMPLVTPHVSSDEEQSTGSVSHSDTFSAPATNPIPASFEPLPIRYSSAPIMPPQPQFALSSMPAPAPVQRQQQQQAAPVDRVLDEAVDALLLSGDDTLADFCFDWDPTGSGMALEDDTQLGYMLEKLLED